MRHSVLCIPGAGIVATVAAAFGVVHLCRYDSSPSESEMGSSNLSARVRVWLVYANISVCCLLTVYFCKVQLDL